MRRYAQVSGVFFSILAIVQLTRVIAGWEVNVANIIIPAWVSAVAFLVAGSFAAWALWSSQDFVDMLASGPWRATAHV